jgi:hypothetical protein
MTNFDSPSLAQLLRTTPSSPRRSHYQTKTLPREKINQTETQFIQFCLDLRGGGLTRTKYYLTGRCLT